MQFQILYNFLFGITGIGSIALGVYEWMKLKSNRFPIVWILFGACLLLSSLPSLQDVLVHYTTIIREQAMKDEWYENRRIFQQMVLLAGGLCGALACVASIGIMWRVSLKYAWAVAGIAGLLAMNGLLFVSNHFTDAVISQQIGGVNLYFITLRYLAVFSLAAVCWGWYCTLTFIRKGSYPGYFNPPKRYFTPVKFESKPVKPLFEAHVWIVALTVIAASQETQPIFKWVAMSLSLVNATLCFAVTLPLAKLSSPFQFLRRVPPMLVAGALFFAWTSYSALSQTNAPMTDWALTLTMATLTSFVCAFVFSLNPDGGSLLRAMTIAGVAVALEGLIFELRRTHGLQDVALFSPFRRDIAAEDNTRLGFPFTHANNFGTASNFFITFAICNLFRSKKIAARAVWLGVAGMFAAIMILTGSRGALILILPVTVAALAREYKVLRIPALCATFVIGAALLWAVRRPFTHLRGSGSLRQRAHQWVVTSQILQRNPIFGEGPGAFMNVWKSYGPGHGYANQFALDSFYANLLCEGGFAGLGALVLLCSCTIWETGRLQNSDAPKSLRDTIFYLALALGSALLHNVIQPNLNHSLILLLFAILGGMIAGVKSNLLKMTSSSY